jgi:hypothetical protein
MDAVWSAASPPLRSITWLIPIDAIRPHPKAIKIRTIDFGRIV